MNKSLEALPAAATFPLAAALDEIQKAVSVSCFNPATDSIDNLRRGFRIKNHSRRHDQSKLSRPDTLFIQWLFKNQIEQKVVIALGLGNVMDGHDPLSICGGQRSQVKP